MKLLDLRCCKLQTSAHQTVKTDSKLDIADQTFTEPFSISMFKFIKSFTNEQETVFLFRFDLVEVLVPSTLKYVKWE